MATQSWNYDNVLPPFGKSVEALDHKDYTGAAITGATIDLQNGGDAAKKVVFVITFGSVNASQDFGSADIVVQEDDENTFTGATTVTSGQELSIDPDASTHTDGAQSIIVVPMEGRKRYLRLKGGTASAHQCIMGATAYIVSGNAKYGEGNGTCQDLVVGR